MNSCTGLNWSFRGTRRSAALVIAGLQLPDAERGPSIFYSVRLRCWENVRRPVNSVTRRCRIWFSSDAFSRPSFARVKRWTSDEPTWKTMNRQANLGRSYQDYISHFRLHPRDLKPLLPSGLPSGLWRATRTSSFLSVQNVQELEGFRVTPLSKRPPGAILDTDKSCPSFFNTRVILLGSLPQTSLFQRSHRQYRTGERARWRFLIGLFQRREFYLALPPLIWLIDEDLDPLRRH